MGKGVVRLLGLAATLGSAVVAGFAAVTLVSPARGDILPTTVPLTTVLSVTTVLPTTVPLPTTTVPRLPTTTTVPLPPVTSTTVRVPTTSTTVRLPTTSTTVRLPTTVSTTPTSVTTVAPLPPTTSTAAAGAARSAASPPPQAAGATTSSGSSTVSAPPSTAAAAAAAGAAGAPSPIVDSIRSTAVAARSAATARLATPGARGKRAARAKRATAIPHVRAERVSASSAGLAAFYAGLDKALAQMNHSPLQEVGQTSLWPLQAQEGGVLSRNGAIALGAALLAVGLLFGFALLPRLAAAGFLPMSRSSAQVMRESLVLTLGAVAVCLFLAMLLLRASV